MPTLSRLLRALLVAGLLGVGFCCEVVAQKPSMLRGFVKDQLGAPIAGAAVILRHLESKKALSTISGSSGRFEFRDLAPGKYLLQVQANGFTPQARAITLKGSKAPETHFVLQLAPLHYEIKVTAEEEGLSAAVDTNADAIKLGLDEIENLPVKDQDFLRALSLFLSPTTFAEGGPTVIVDGMERSDLKLPASAIQEVRINHNPYSVEFGHPGKEKIEITTKSGTPAFHGGFSFFFRDSRLDARNAFAPVRPMFQRKSYDASLGGPVPKTKLSFFISASHDDKTENATVFALTPDGPFRANVLMPSLHTRLLGRIDWRPNENHTLSGRYELKREEERNRGIGGFRLPEHGSNGEEQGHRVEISARYFSPKAVNNLRIVIGPERKSENSLVDRPSLIVLDAFTSGGAQVNDQERQRKLDLQEVADLARGRHFWKIGGEVHHKIFRHIDASDFRGRFQFSTLADFVTGRPFLFVRNEGDPRLRFKQVDYTWFIQDQFRLRPNLHLSLGLRHEFQNNLSDRNNFAPRLGFAYAPSGSRKLVLRGGFGFFYDRQPPSMTERSLRFDGQRVRQIVIRNPGYPDPFSGSEGITILPTSIVLIAPDLHAPYMVQASLAVERELRRQTVLTVEYATQRGVKLYRMRNVNAPLPFTRTRPDPSLGNINQFESSASSRLNSLTISLRSHMRKSLQFIAQYALSKALSDTGGSSSLPADNYNLRGEWGRADSDRRHRFSFVSTAKLPLLFQFGTIVSLTSGRPFNITTGFDDNQDTVANDRPQGVNRNSGQGPGFANVDARLAREFNVPHGF